MNILLVTPALPSTTTGNGVTAQRYARLFRGLGHRVRLRLEYRDERCDLLVALHARRSAPSIRRFRRLHPEKPLIVVLTGTDLYRDLNRSPVVLESLKAASALVVLQPHALRELPRRFRRKAVAIIQSVSLPSSRRTTKKTVPGRGRSRALQIVQLAHLRPVKDPFLVARALRHVPEQVPLRIVHAGHALQPGSAERARRWMRKDTRYRWIGAVSRPRALRLLGSADLLVLSSKLEGGANVLCEALALRVPALCSDIPGSTGILGRTYPGYFPAGDARALARQLHRAASDRPFLRRLQRACRELRPLVAPDQERKLWQRLLARLGV